ncbi:hypothetical protein G9A89_004978 [Geosiphon pyriformis]|nr:hypothetical protein G9A89_004978 [Geosiphon pyriformis]
MVSGNSRRFVCDVFCLVHHARWEIGSGSWAVADGLRAGINWSMSSLVWHPNSHLAAGSTSIRMAGFWTYFMKAFHCWLLVAVHKCLYDRRYPSVVCLYCGDVEISDHVFSCSYNTTGCAQLLDIHALAWATLSGLFWSSSCVLQLLATCASEVGIGATLYKGFVFNNWYHKSVSVFRDSKVGASKIVDFVCGFCLVFRDDIWLVHTRHQTFMEKHGLVLHNGSTPVSVSGLSVVFSAGVVRLLSVAKAFGVGFGFCKFCPFFSGIGDLVSFAGWVVSTLVPDATFKIKLAHVKTVFQSVHGFLGAKSVLKDNVKLFCVEFAFQTFLDAAFLVELTSSVHFATLKIAKSLVVFESGSFSAAVALHDMSLGVSAANIKTALSVFGMITHVVLKPAGIWQYVMVHFKKLNSAIVRIFLLVNQNETILSCNRFKTKLVNLPSGCTVFEISNMISQIGGQSCFIPQSPNSGYCLCFALVTFGSQADLDLAVAKTDHLAVDCKVVLSPFLKTSKMFKPHFVGFLSYAKAFVPPVMSEFLPLVVSAPPMTVVDSAVGSRLDSLKKQISDLAALVKFIVEPVGSLIVLVSYLLDNNTVITVQLEQNLLSIKYAFNNFANLLVGVSKNIACFRSEATKPSLLSDDTVERIIVLWQMSGAEVRSSVESTRLFLT